MNSLLMRPLQVHLDGNREGRVLTALQAEEEASRSSHHYSNEGILTKALDAYLKRKRTPADFHTIAMATRAHRIHSNLIDRKVKAQTASRKAGIDVSIQAATSSASSIQENNPIIVQQASTSSNWLPSPIKQPTLVHVDPDAQADWDGLPMLDS